jgi:hypothetical protein
VTDNQKNFGKKTIHIKKLRQTKKSHVNVKKKSKRQIKKRSGPLLLLTANAQTVPKDVVEDMYSTSDELPLCDKASKKVEHKVRSSSTSSEINDKADQEESDKSKTDRHYKEQIIQHTEQQEEHSPTNKTALDRLKQN